MSADLSAAKADLPALLGVLGLERAGNHGPCRFCDSRDAMSIFASDAGWGWRCHACHAAGDIVSASLKAKTINFKKGTA
jgi:hypothetical protein